MQNIVVSGSHVHLSKKSDSNCLGADDAVGIFLMREMILAQRPGLYVFHREEESGGIGSRAIALDMPETVRGIGYAIAFDRRGTADVITHQAGYRCCSDTFAQSLARQLGGAFTPSPDGIFTDTANYTDLIGECTNVSVGYRDEHTTRECVDLRHVAALRDAVLTLDPSGFAYAREPGEEEWDFPPASWPFEDEDQQPKPQRRSRAIPDLIRDYPDQIADLLEEYGFSYDALTDEIYQRGGR